MKWFLIVACAVVLLPVVLWQVLIAYPMRSGTRVPYTLRKIHPLVVPTLADLPPGLALDSVFGPAPRPSFRQMTRSEPARSGPEPWIHTGEMTVAEGAHSVVERRTRAYGSEWARYWTVGLADLFPVLTVHSDPGKPGVYPYATTRRRVERIENAEGRLFPLAVGNRLRFRALGTVEYPVNPFNYRPRPTSEVWEYHVTGTTAEYAAGEAAVPGIVYVIEATSDEFSQTAYSIHYAEALGAAVWVRRQPAGLPPKEQRLVSWQ